MLARGALAGASTAASNLASGSNGGHGGHDGANTDDSDDHASSTDSKNDDNDNDSEIRNDSNNSDSEDDARQENLSIFSNHAIRTLGVELVTWLRTEDRSLEDGVKVVHNLCSSLWLRPWVATLADPLPDPTQRFCILYSLQRNGAHTPPKYITKLFAQLKYMIRLHVLGDIAASGDPQKTTEDLKPWYTAKAAMSTFTTIYGWQKMASSIVMSEPPPLTIFWVNPDNWDALRVHGNIIHISDVQEMFHKMEDEMVHTFEHAVLLDLPLDVNTSGLTEDLAIQEPGYSFLNDARNATQLKGTDTALYDAIMADERLRDEFTVVVDGCREWRYGRLRAWLTAYTELSRLYLLRCEMLAGGPRRGTELIFMLYRSSETQPDHNLSLVDQYRILRTTYGKTSSISGKDRFILHSLDAVTGDVMLRDLIFARPFAVMAASMCFPAQPENADRYKSYLFVNNTRLFTTEDLSSAMKIWTGKYLKYAFGVQVWRHVSIGWRRKKCPGASYFAEDYEDYIGAEQAGHSWRVETKVYGLSPDALAGLPEDSLHLYLRASGGWQSVMRTVPGTVYASRMWFNLI